MYKLICVDVDGTLIDNKNRISERTKNALLEAQRRGTIVAIISGRPDNLVFDHLRTLRLPQYAGAIGNYNGTKLTLCETGEVIFDKKIKHEIAIEYLKEIEKYHFQISILDNENIYSTADREDEMSLFFQERPAMEQVLNEENEEIFILPEFQYHKVDKISEVLDFEPHSIQIAGDTNELLEVFGEIHDKFNDVIHLTFTSDSSLEAMPKGITKATSMRKLVDYYGIELKDVLAFGDSQNDYEMIRDAGCGVAMENAQSIVKEVADYITLTNLEDGIAVFLEKHVLN